ncbi:amino acid adenylation domain-containing protein, partial [Comamonas sp. JC664]
VSVWEFFWPLAVGARLVVARPGGHQEPAYLAKVVKEERVSTLHFVPSMLRAFLEEPGLEGLSALRRVVCSGEALDAELVKKAYARLPAAVVVHNLYGPTEAAVDVSYWPCPRDTQLQRIPIGKPVANTMLYVLDGHGQPTPVGIPGELHIGGVQVGRGYRQRPELTAERFIPDAFSSTPGARLYRTGDVARWLPDGTLEYLGRADFQVKLRGFRIELGEIEAALRGHPSVRDAVAVVRQETQGDARLIAYVTGDAEPLTPATLQAHLQKQLPSHMVPSVFVHLGVLPLTPSGKVDRKALPAPEAPTAQPGQHVAPRTPTEEALAGLFSTVLGVRRVGIHDGFFELGGHSLLATQVMVRVRTQFGVELPLRAFFEAPTVAGLAAFLDAQRQVPSAPAVALPPLVPVDRSSTLPLSFAQQRLWFVSQLSESGSSAYNLAFPLKLQGALNLPALQQSFDELVRRHEALRTTFRLEGDAPVQVIHPTASVPLEVLDLTDLTEAEVRHEETLRLVQEEARYPFDLEQGPLMRALLMKHADTDHVLVLNLHHIVTDGWSNGVMVRELAALYAAFSQGQPSPLPALPIQYADFAVWQRQWLQGEVMDAQLDYWRGKLAGAPSHLELPTDKPRPAQQSFRGASTPLSLSNPLSEALETLAKREAATPFMVLLAAFQVVLSRYSGQEDILVGSPIAGRRQAESEDLIGFFVNNLVLRSRVQGHVTFRSLLAQVRDTTLGAYEHQDVPFEKLVEVLQPERDPSRTPLFQVSFTLHNAPLPALSLAGLTLSLEEPPPSVVRFDLELQLQRTTQGFEGGINYSTALFTADTAARLSRRLAALLEAAVASPDVPLSRLSLLTPDERKQVLTDVNATAVDYPRDTAIHALFAAQAARSPGSVAVSSATRPLTYRQLDQRANQLAHHLRTVGVRPGARVGLCVERSPDLIVGMLGILKAGAAYVPVEPRQPTERITSMLHDARVSVLLSQDAIAEELPDPGCPLVLLDADAQVIGAQPVTAPEVPVGGDDLAYVMFTSGSTGRPKGVGVPHRGVVRLVKGSSFVRFGPREVFLQLAPAAFDASTFEIWGALLHGARLVLAPPKALAVEDLGALLVRESITTLWLTAALFEQVAASQGDALSQVRQVLAGGDVLSVPRVREHLARLAPEAVLVNGYGPTENTTFSATQALRSGDRLGRSVPVGRPIANSTTYVLDADLHPVPPDVPGELFVGGDGLAWGYLEQPALTAERFIPHPFATTPGARLYRTGDKARWRPDGTLEFLGRADFQVKVRGFRIEPAEIEAVLRQFAGVEDTVVVAREDTPGDKRLVAYVSTEAPAQLDVAALRAFVQKQLPDYMVPSAVVALPALPLNANGKVDRKALPKPEAPKPVVSQAAAGAPRSPLEAQLVFIWSEVLGAAQVGIHDDFFELGGHSLLATQVVTRVREALGVDLSLSDLFARPTVAGLAEHLGPVAGAAAPRTSTIAKASRTGDLPLSFAQQRLWFIDQMEPGNTHYNVPLPLQLEGALDASALQRSLQELVRRHESLRTTFRAVAGQPVQVIHPTVPVPFEDVDLSGIPDEALRRAEAVRRATEEARRPFDLRQGPVLRTLLLRLGAHESLLLLHVHHIVSDGWSLGVLVRELTALYVAFRQGRPSPLPALPVQYADYAVWQRSDASTKRLDAQLDWWKQQLADAPHALELPTDKPRPAVYSYRGATLHVALGRELTQRVEARAQSEGVTPFMLLLAVYQLLLHRHSGQDDVLVGSPIANRTQGATEGLIGFFVNTLVLRARFTPGLTPRQLLAQVRDTTLGAYEHQDLPFERLVEELNPVRDPSRPPLVQSLFAVQNAPVPELALPELTVRAADLGEAGIALSEVSLELARTSEGFSGTLKYSTDLFEAATAERLFAHYLQLLEGFLGGPDASVESLPVMSGAEAHRLLTEWSGAAVPAGPPGALFHERIEQHAARTPEAPAVVLGDQVLTYAQLNARANQLAAHLRTLGVAAETRVALCLERTPEALIALLAVLKAGGAFVPIDPSAPAQRKAFIFQDSTASILLTVQPLADAWEPAFGYVLCLDTDAAQFASLPVTDVASRTHEEALAYVIYTSGSTGTPKGVMVPHRSFGAMQDAVAHVFQEARRPPWRISLNAPLHFDGSLVHIVHLAQGDCLCLVPEDTRKDPKALVAWVQAQRVNALDCAPAQLSLMVEAGLLDAPQVPERIVCGGEAMSPALWNRLARAERTEAFNAYGPTESTVCVTLERVWRSESQVPRIGGPLAGTRLYVLDAAQRLTPTGVAGELYIAGANLARGYLGRPELTAERFVPNPFAAAPGERMYRTGDKVRWCHDGTLEYLGRLDFQVKLRGFRIELGEIEVALRGHPFVREAVVMAREDATGGKRLVAYVVSDAESPVSVEDLRGFLQQRLPDYMLPSVYVPLESLPLTPSAKVDRKALPHPDVTQVARERVIEPPATPTEATLVELWKALLHVPEVSRRDNFFELGGHSLLATQVVARLREVFGVELGLQAFFEAPTVAGLAARLGAAAPEARLPPLTRSTMEGPLPLSFAQQRLWFLDQLQPGGSAYNIPSALRLSGALELTALQHAVDALVQRHASLRTTFHAERGAPHQVIHSPRPLPLTVVDLSGAQDVARREAEAVKHATDDFQRPFDLAAGPLLRVTVLKLTASEHVLLVCMHHIVSDGWSMGVLVREVAALYEDFRAGQPARLPELPVQYADYAVWQRAWMQGEALRRQLDWWKHRLAGAPHALELPTDTPRPAVLGHQGAFVPVHLSSALSEAVESLAQREGATPFMVLLAAFQAVLARHSGQEDVVVGSPIAGRRHAQTEGLIGFFINTLALRARLSPGLTFRQLLAQVRDTTLGAYEHQDLPFERLVEELQPARDLGRSPLFQVLFALQNAPDAELSLPGLTLSPLESSRVVTKFEMELSLSRTEDGFRGGLVYSTELFERGRVERLVAHLSRALEAAVASPDSRVATLPWLTELERQRMLMDGGGAPGHPSGSGEPLEAGTPWLPRQRRAFHERFEQQAAQTPEAPAVVLGDQGLTYAQLNARANQLAAHLRTLGVGPERRVGLCLDRSPDAVVAVLAVLKAGGAFVPIDPAAPAERKRFVLEDSQASVLVAHQRLVEDWQPHVKHRVWLDTEAAHLSTLPARDVPGAAHADPAAYVLYTSGSTGTPKGVVVQHHAWEALHRAMARAFFAGLPNGQRLSLNAPLYFDVSLGQLIHLSEGGHCLCLVPEATRRDPEAMVAWLEAQRVDVLDCTPAQLTLLLQAGLLERAHVPRRIVCAGEAMDASLWRRLAESGRTEAFNAYGPTESTVYATFAPVRQPRRETAPATEQQRAEAPHHHAVVPVIGQPLVGTQVYVLDEHLSLSPQGAAGELFLAGAGLARGYLDRPALTAERFVPNPFATTPGERMYRTGDKVRWREDGTLEYLGRLDFQVKLRGFRIELGEIEAALRTHAHVRDAVVLAREDVPGDKRLVAYVVPDRTEDAGLSTEALRHHLQQRLPEYMVPSAFVSLTSLPLTPSGKVDRKVLPPPNPGDSGLKEAHVPPRDALELQLLRVWEQVLGMSPISVRSSFFELGGHSLLAVRLVAELRESLGQQLPLAALFQTPTVEQLAALLRRGDSAHATTLVPFATARGGTEVPFFCVHPVGGNVLAYAELARLLGAERPFYGIQAQGLDGGAPPRTTVEEMATAYVSAIRTVQPSGPYVLGGWSVGGVIAYEMARQLREQGDTVALLALIDAYTPAALNVAEPERTSTQAITAFASDLLGMGLTGLAPDAAPLRGDSPEAVLDTLWDAGHHAGALPPGMEREHLRALFRVFEANLRAARRYQPAAMNPGRVLLLKATGNAAEAPADGGWGALVGAGLETHPVSGDHYSVLKAPSVRELAERIREALKLTTG